jgi:hypothetical protein
MAICSGGGGDLRAIWWRALRVAEQKFRPVQSPDMRLQIHHVVSGVALRQAGTEVQFGSHFQNT